MKKDRGILIFAFCVKDWTIRKLGLYDFAVKGRGGECAFLVIYAKKAAR